MEKSTRTEIMCVRVLKIYRNINLSIHLLNISSIIDKRERDRKKCEQEILNVYEKKKEAKGEDEEEMFLIALESYISAVTHVILPHCSSSS